MKKSRTVDLERGECFGFLGFDFRYLHSSLRGGALRPHYTPKLKKRTALMRELKEVFRRHRSQPIERVINLINPVLRGWVNYFAGWGTPVESASASSKIGWRRRSGANWRMLRSERASAGDDGVSRGYA